MIQCEFCDNIHDGKYGSGRFCNKQCACGFSTKNKRTEINKKVSDKLKNRIGNNKNGFKSGKYWNGTPLSNESREKAKLATIKKHEDYIKNTPFHLLHKSTIKKILINERGHKCERCQTEKWLENLIPLELEHIDGDNTNNIKSNCILLCPNCHAFTPTYRGKNINTLRKIDNESFLRALKNNISIRQALIQLNLTPCGGNYDRAKRLLFS